MSCYTTPSSGEEMKPAQSTPKSQKEVGKKIYDILRKNGYTDAAAKGVLANIRAESGGMNPDILGWDGSIRRNEFGIGGGLIGFYFYGRLKELAMFIDGNTDKIVALNNKVKNSNLPQPKVPAHSANTQYIRNTLKLSFPYSLEDQMRFLTKNVKPELKVMTDPKQATNWFMNNVESPHDTSQDRWKDWGKTIENMLS